MSLCTPHMLLCAGLVTLLLTYGKPVSGRNAFIELEDKQLRNFVNQHDSAAVVFYAEWCKLCEEFNDVAHDVALELSPNVHFARLNGGKYREPAYQYVQDVFPAVALFRNGTFDGHTAGTRSKESLAAWIHQRTSEPVVFTPDLETARREAKKYSTAFIGRFSSRTTSNAKLYEAFAAQHRNWGRFVAYVDEALEREHVSVTFPEEDERVLYDFDNLVDWAANNRLPLLGPLDHTNQRDYYSVGKDLVTLIGSVSDYKKYGDYFRKAAVELAKRYSFAWLNSESKGADRTIALLRVSTLPTFMVILGTGNVRNHQRYAYPAKGYPELSSLSPAEIPKKILKFVKDCEKEKIHPVVRAQPKPSKEALGRENILWFHGNNLRKHALAPRMDTFVVLTAPPGDDVFPGCKLCEPLLTVLDYLVPTVREILHELSGSDDEEELYFQIGEFSVTNNEFPLRNWAGTWELQSLPAIYFIPKGERSFVELPSVSSLDPVVFLEFWEKHTRLDIVKNAKLAKLLGTLRKDWHPPFAEGAAPHSAEL